MNTVAQIIGFVAMMLSVTSFQMKTKKQIIVMQCLTSGVFALHYLLLPEGAGIAGGVVNLVAIVRNIVFYFNYKPVFKSRLWVVLFCILMGGSAIVSRPEPISVFMCVAMVFNTLSIASAKPVNVRKIILISSPFALTYNIVVGSMGGIINELLVEIITAITLFRESRETKNNI